MNEKQVIGNMLMGVAQEDYAGTSFSNLDNRIIFDQMREMQDAGRPVDVITVANELQTEGLLDMVGGLEYLAETAGMAA